MFCHQRFAGVFWRSCCGRQKPRNPYKFNTEIPKVALLKKELPFQNCHFLISFLKFSNCANYIDPSPYQHVPTVPQGSIQTLDLSVVTFIMDSLADREGFTNSQFERCKKSFEHFDVNGSFGLE